MLDEVIGAGDANFMNKAKQRIVSLVEQADILILASHDFSALENLCQRGVVLHRGEIVFDGAVSKAIIEYKKVNGLS